jgi:hypothetical protein
MNDWFTCQTIVKFLAPLPGIVFTRQIAYFRNFILFLCFIIKKKNYKNLFLQYQIHNRLWLGQGLIFNFKRSLWSTFLIWESLEWDICKNGEKSKNNLIYVFYSKKYKNIQIFLKI